MTMNYNIFKSKYLWKRVDYDWFPSWWQYQCVDLIRQYIKEMWWQQPSPLWNNWCKYFALNPYYYFNPEKFERVKNTISNKPEQWDIVIFSKPISTGHIALVDSANYLSLKVLEQNAWSGDGSWLGTNAIKLWTYSYYNVMWRFKKRTRMLNI